MTIRSLNPTLTASLLENDEFVYAHLVKFEKPLKTSTGDSGQRANDYSYITDGSHDIVFNDGSKNTDGNFNGAQTYLAGKLLSVGAINETIEARASSINLVVSATSLNTISSVSFTTTTSTIITNLDLVKEGFVEGDIIRVSATGGSNNGIKVRVDAFANNNKTLEVTAVDGTLSADSTLRAATLTFDSPEVNGILADKDNAAYAGYINRDVQIYKAHINPTTGEIIGAPYLIFKGIIGTANLSEDPEKESRVSWGITSHWGDFQSVNGRLTSDQHHRALDGNSVPDRSALIRPEYANDLGFLHSEQAINLVSIYQVMETRYKLKKKKKFLGFAKYKQIEYKEEVDRETDLRFNLDAKYLPVVYGVQKIDSIPFFVDTDKTDSKQVFVAYALCEGEIGGVFDMYFDDTSSICVDKNDNDTRSSQTTENTIDVLCTGRMDRGDVLTAVAPVTNNFQSLDEAIEHGFIPGSVRAEIMRYEDEINQVDTQFSNQESSSGASVGAGLIHEKGHSIQSPIDGKFIVHAGKRGQSANALLVDKAQSRQFKIQQDYFSGPKQNYWGTNHRVLDTAYVVAQYTIGEGETTIPEVDFVVRGKLIKCYNYDRAYNIDSSQSSAALSNFNLGDSVAIKKTSDNSTINASVTIKDIFTITGRDGVSVQKVQFAEDLGLGLTTAFYMELSSNKYYLQTWDNPAVTGDVAAKLEESVVSVAAGTNRGVKVTVSSSSDTAKAFEDFSGVRISLFPTTADQGYINNLNSQDLLITYSSSNPGVADNIAHDSVANFNAAGINKILVKNVLKLPNTASSVDDAYVGKVINVTKIESDGSSTTQTRRIVDYDGANRLVKVDMAFDGNRIPDTTFKFSILSSGDDRVSINPAMQVLDYLQDRRYGKGLDLNNDLDLDGFKAAGRDCDTTSDVTTQFASSVSISVGEKYRFPATGATFWQGTVKSISSLGGKKEVTFTDCSGKLGNKWFEWKTYTDGDLVWHGDNVYIKSGTGTIAEAPSGSSATVTLRKVGTSTDINVDTTEANFDGNPVVKKFNSSTSSYLSGYSLYDSDFVKYWKYLGWESQHQRHVTRHQTNTVVDTGSPVFDNINNMLLQFNGLLRYSSGKYTLEIAGASTNLDSVTVGSTTYYPGLITEDDIIGSIQVEDSGLKGTYNTVSVSVPDPANRYEDRSVTFFNSDYLKEDRNMTKKGDINTPNVTNYFNARINAKQYLERSRYGLSINFKMPPKGFLLLPGEIIRVTYPRFGFNQKMFRISNVGLAADCLVNISAEEHNDDAFLIQEENRQLQYVGSESSFGPSGTPGAPSSLTATTNERGGIVLNWSHAANYNRANWSVEVWRNSSSSFTGGSGAEQIATVKSDTYTDQITTQDFVSRYYWVRYAVDTRSIGSSGTQIKTIFSVFHPTKVSSGVLGQASGAVDGISIVLSNDNASVATNSDNSLDFSNTSANLEVFLGSTQLNYDSSSPFATPSFRVTNVSAFNVTAGSTTNDSNTYSLANITGMSANVGRIELTVVVKDTTGTETTFVKTQRFSKSLRGAAGSIGSDAVAVSLASDTQAITYNAQGESPDPSAAFTFTATAQNLDSSITYYYQFLKDGSSVQNTTSNTYSYTPPTAFATLPDVIQVRLRESGTGGTIVATDTFTVFGVKPGGDSLTLLLSNEAHTLSTTNTGTVNFSGSGTEIRLFQGATQLAFDGSGTSNGTFRVTTSGTSITPGSITDGGNHAVVGNHSSMTANDAAVLYTIIGKRLDGTAINIQKTQSLSKSVEGADGTNAINTRTSTIFRKNNSSINSTAGTFANPLNGNSNWSFSVPAISTDGDEVYSSTRTFTSDGNSPQDSSWSTPVVAFKRVDGETVTGPAGQSARQVNLYQKSSSTPSYSTTGGSYSNPRSGNTAWSFSVPSISANGDKVWVISRTFTSDGNSPQDSAWSAPVIYAQRTDGQVGPDGLRTIQGYLYYEKTSSGAPGAPGGNTYTFSTGLVSGSGINDSGTTNCWKNTPRPQDPSSTNTQWTVRYFGIEASASSSTITVTYSSVVQYTNFTGVVTFSGGTFSQGGTNLSASNVSGFGDSNFSGNANDLNVSNAGSFRNAIGAGTGNSNFSGSANDLNNFNQSFLQGAINNNATFRTAVGAGTGNSNFSGSFNDLNDLSGVASAINNNTTTIDGAKITTGSIAADRIATNTITASAGIIANAAISNAMIDTISATKITTDTLSAERINIDGITLSRDGDSLIIKTGGVDTQQIGDGAISSVSSDTEAGDTPSSATKNEVVIASTTIDSAGGEVIIFAGAKTNPAGGRGYTVVMRIKQNCSSATSTGGTLVGSVQEIGSGDLELDLRRTITSTVSGTNRINVTAEQTSSNSFSPSLQYNNRSLTCLELKR